LAFSLKQVNQDELKTREFEYSEQDAVAQQVAPQGLFSTMVKGLDLFKHVFLFRAGVMHRERLTPTVKKWMGRWLAWQRS